jgi:MFS family permease
MIPLAGKLASVFPLRWVYQIAFVIFLVGSVICGAAKGSNLFIFGRAVAGIGAAGIASGGLTVIVTISTPAKRPLFIGITSSMFALGVILAPIMGGALTEKVSWRWCFYINLPPGGVTLLIMYFFFRPRRFHADEPIAKRLKRLDIIGALMFVPASFMLLIAMQWGGTRYPWNSATVIGLFVGGGVLTLVFIAWQWHQGDDALIPGTIVGRRNVALTCMFSFCFLGGLAVMSYYLPEWFQAVRGVSPLQSGVRVLPSVITQILALLVVGVFGMFTLLLHRSQCVRD